MHIRLLLVCIFLIIPATSSAEELIIQPGPEEGKDTYYGINSVGGKEGRPNAGEFRIGGWGDTWTSYIEFKLNSIPDEAVIEEAKLYLFNRTATNQNSGKLYRVTESWQESDPSINNQVSFVDYGMEFQLVENEAWWIVDVTEIVGGWVNGEYENYGFAIRGQYNSNNHVKHFASSDYLDDPSLRPYLKITYSVPEPEPETPEDTIAQLLSYFESIRDSLSKPVVNAYDAHVKKLLPFYEDGLSEALISQLRALRTKVDSDLEKGAVDEAVGGELLPQIEEVEEALEVEVDSEKAEVPLITQIASPYPPESAEWAEKLYADGRAADDCGTTIGQCGCALTSFAMLGQSYGLMQGIDGSVSTPDNINDWLLENDGYDALGNINWQEAVKYFGVVNNGVVKSYFSVPDWITDEATKETLAQRPVVIETKATDRSGRRYTHFVLGTGIEESLFQINDPLWYNTIHLDDIRDRTAWVQDYNNLVTSGRDFEYSAQPTKVARHLTIHLGSPAELVLTDSRGRKLGYDPRTGTRHVEIPDGDYYEQGAFYSEELAESGVEPHVTKILDVALPEGELFTLEVIGTGAGDYHLSVATTDGAGEGELENFSGDIESGAVDSYVVDVPEGATSAQAVERLRELADAKELEQPEVAARLRAIAEQLEAKNSAVADEAVAAAVVGE